MKGHGERCELMIDHRSYKHDLSGCEMKFKYVIFKHKKTSKTQGCYTSKLRMRTASYITTETKWRLVEFLKFFLCVCFRLFYLFIYFTYFYFTTVRRNSIVFCLYLHLRLCSSHKCEPGLRSGG